MASGEEMQARDAHGQGHGPRRYRGRWIRLLSFPLRSCSNLSEGDEKEGRKSVESERGSPDLKTSES